MSTKEQTPETQKEANEQIVEAEAQENPPKDTRTDKVVVDDIAGQTSDQHAKDTGPKLETNGGNQTSKTSGVHIGTAATEESGFPSIEEVIATIGTYLTSDKLDLYTTTERKLRQQVENQYKVSLNRPEYKEAIKSEVQSWLDKRAAAEAAERDEEPPEYPSSSGRKRRTVAKSKKETNESGEKRSNRASGLTRNCHLSEPLKIFLGLEVAPRTLVIKKIWEYIKLEELQDPKDRRQIILDGKLKTIFTAPLDMFSMNKQLSKHVKTIEGSNHELNEDNGPTKRKASEINEEDVKEKQRKQKQDSVQEEQ